MRKLACAVAGLAMMAAMVGEARAEFVAIGPYASGSLLQTTSFPPPGFSLGGGSSLFNFNGSPPGPRGPIQSQSGYFKFDLGAIPVGAEIVSATLEITHFAENLNSSLGSVSLGYSAGGSRAEAATLADFTDRRNGTSGTLILTNPFPPLPSPRPPAVVDLTAVVAANFGSTRALAVQFSLSTVNSQALVSPVVRIEYSPAAVPEPSSLVLCGVALAGGLGAWASRRAA